MRNHNGSNGRKFVSVIAIVAAMTSFAGCSNSSQSGNDTNGVQADTITFAIPSDPTSLNPINTSDRYGITVTNLLYEPLARQEANGGIVNELASKIDTAADDTSVTVTLKKGLKWSDGKRITADDVVFSYKAQEDKKSGNADSLWLDGKPIGVEALNDSTVKFTLPVASAGVAASVPTITWIIPKHIYGGVKDFSVTKLDPIAVGSGPYRLDEYKKGQYLTFSANNEYYGTKAKIGKVVFRVIANSATVTTALQTGEIDAANVQPSDIKKLQNSGVSTYQYSEGRIAYIGFNTQKILKDVRVRQALSYSLNRDEIASAAWLNSNYYKLAYTILPPDNPFATSEINKYTKDIGKAKSLLKKAGVTNPTVSFAYDGSDPAQTAEATVIQQEAQRAGFKIDLRSGDASAIQSELDKGGASEYDAFLGGYIMGIDPDPYKALFGSTASSNFFGYKNSKVDELFGEGVGETDNAKRKEIYVQLQKTMDDDPPIYPIADNLKILAVNKRIGGIKDAKLVAITALQNYGNLYINK